MTIAAALAVIAGLKASVLNHPRPGDRLTVSKLDHIPAFMDSAALCPNLYDVRISRTEKMSVWEPAPDDSLSYAIVMTGHDMEYLIERNDTLFCHYEVRPGYARRYTGLLPYGCCPIKTNRVLSSRGIIDAITGYSTYGYYTIDLTNDLTIITHEGDTLQNVTCHAITISDTVSYGDGTTNLHECSHRRWYAPGYRYPILENKVDKLYYSDNDSTEIYSTWNMIDAAVQESEIEDDPLNEQIRSIAKENINRRYNIPDNKDDAGNNQFPKYISWDDDHRGFTISNTFIDGRLKSVLICDISGRVYYVGSFNGDKEEIRIDLDSYPRGVYLLGVSWESSSSETVRFTL